MLTVFTCGPEPEDIFTAVYDAWASRLGHGNVELEIEAEEQQARLFSQYRHVERDREKAEKVARSVYRKISAEAWQGIYQTALSFEPDRADAIYRFLIEGFRIGPDVVNRLQNPAVCRVFELSRKMGREAHYFVEFVRFTQWENGVLYAKVAPKCNVLPLVAPHFANRLSGETWVIYDEVWHKAAVHPVGPAWYLMDTLETGWDTMLCSRDSVGDGSGWENLWKTFVRHIAIEARINPKLQQNMMPLWYRKHMTEHVDSSRCRSDTV